MPDRLAQLIRDHQPCVALSGAGVATESGVPDFRSPTGIWAKLDPMEYATLTAFRRDPAKVWWFYRQRIEMLTAARPNRGHYALRELEELGLLSAIVTQNIDMLHRGAGSQDVVEVHGSIGSSSCQSCGRRHELERVEELLDADPGVPACDGCDGVLKPDVVFFEEQLPVAAIDRAYELAKQAGVLLVIGSSLEVHPVAGLPERTLAAGGRVAIVNRGPTSFDRRATLKLDASAGETLASVVGLLRQMSPRAGRVGEAPAE
ncbi:MAG: SIR2 family NAD-dependent protein deacylase [Gaiellaceae bacterium]